MTFPIKERIITELFIDKKQWVNIQKGDKETDQENIWPLGRRVNWKGEKSKAWMKTLWEPVWNDLHYYKEGKTN